MQESHLYPSSPSGVPDNLTKANSNYKKHAWLAMLGLLVFMLFYIALMLSFGAITFYGISEIQSGSSDLFQIVITGCALLLTIFMAKSLFAVKKAGNPGGVEVTEETEPKLFKFLHTLADEVGAPRPHRVFITPEVNAAVFYDLSLINLFFPSKKNLIVGLGLVNVLNLGELKAVLAHEFGHFAQGSMMVGRWVYIAQQIIAHMVATRDWLDSIVKFISRIDIRIAWLGWILALIIWSIRSLMDTLFSLVIMAERALSREMEFNADLVAVSVTGSDALVNALHKLQAADHAWQTALNVAGNEAEQGNLLNDLFAAQNATIKEMQRILNDKDYGETPIVDSTDGIEKHRVFTEQSARPPQMWATHPANRDREDNAKSVYVSADIDTRDAWVVFNNAKDLKSKISLGFYKADSVAEMKSISPLEAILKNFDRASYHPRYRGSYLNRSPVRSFACVEELLSSGSVKDSAKESLALVYPEKLSEQLEIARNLDIEKDTLEALARGELKPSGGVIRHRGEELKTSDIPDAIQEIVNERSEVEAVLKDHDASCRRAHLQAAKELNSEWHDYLKSLIELLHCSEHMLAKAQDENALFVNTWSVITADGQIGFFEKRRMINVCKKMHSIMDEISAKMLDITLPKKIEDIIGIENWKDQCPQFDLVEVNKSNWGEWCSAASDRVSNIIHVLGIIHSVTLEELIKTEFIVREFSEHGKMPDEEHVLDKGKCPSEYPVLLPGSENVLQRKLDLWNRFQLAHGFMPTLARLIVALGIVGGTIYGGYIGL